MDQKLLAWQIGRNIRFHRNRLGLTQKEVFNSMKCDRRFYQRIEVGKSFATINTLSRISNLFNIPVQELISINKIILDGDEECLLNFDWDMIPQQTESQNPTLRLSPTHSTNLLSQDCGIWYCSKKFQILKVNQTLEKLIGLPAEEIVGKKLSQLVSFKNRELLNVQFDCEALGLSNFYFLSFKSAPHSFPLQVHSIPCFKINGEYLGSLSFIAPIRTKLNFQQTLSTFLEHINMQITSAHNHASKNLSKHPSPITPDTPRAKAI